MFGVVALLGMLQGSALWTHGSPSDLAYYEGQWECKGNDSEKMGTLKVSHALGDAFFVFSWTGDPNDSSAAGRTVTFASFNKSKDVYVRGGFNSDGSRVHLTTPGWDGDNSLVWTGTITSHGARTLYVRITETQQDATSYTTMYETSHDGQTYSPVDHGLCTKTSS